MGTNKWSHSSWVDALVVLPWQTKAACGTRAAAMLACGVKEAKMLLAVKALGMLHGTTPHLQRVVHGTEEVVASKAQERTHGAKDHLAMRGAKEMRGETLTHGRKVMRGPKAKVMPCGVKEVRKVAVICGSKVQICGATALALTRGAKAMAWI